MPEGHTIHRAARDQRKMVAGKVLNLSSPQGRFMEGAEHLDGRLCESIEALGKHLLYRFEGDEALHIHLGLYGRIRTHKRPAKEPKGAVRVRIESDTHIIDINGPNRCEVLDRPGLDALFDRIGPDVLRKDADPDRAFERITKSRSMLGLLIMNQDVMAGIGNIYRTEILWRQRLDPEMPGKALTREAFDAFWEDSVALLELGVKHNAIITTDDAMAAKSRYQEKVNIFNKDTCPRCDGPVRRFEIANRRAFVCDACQRQKV